ncbi:MAG: F0F1 ATP synthase subunit A [Deltaproteobacteria bacterium]|nr:F0F1 ATP synthase subunit A [Deltaproteobacteria bacterium]
MADPNAAEAASSLPDHYSWFSVIDQNVHLGDKLGWPFNDEGQRWFFGGDIHLLHVWAFGFVVLLLLLFGLATRRNVADPEEAVVPQDKLTVSNFVELMTSGVYNMMAAMMGKEAAKYFLPLIGTCAFVIFFSNVLGLIPGFLPPTDSLNTTAAMAIVIFIATHVYGIKKQGFVNYFKHFMGPVIWLAPLIFVIELISHLVRPVTLAVRLTANMFADHAVLTVFIGLLLPTVVWFLPLALPVYILGCVVVTVQTLVFCLLSTVYISMAIEDTHAH